ncbi:threonylcarbamoyl-AMP synthase [Oleiphilus sp. HI0125]|uniref:L-threonylcarbamoyladenylate synthase n=1 Tax=Oleiphilus sp. HI0125 TaxID=1822266 RepID=UPI0007C293C6|nr:L-threonylcarbamoyladenylate synthase [Oleiphilus sp. HI0125]KZZ58643.1 threonylcarbamoyl-AMP synthase [Oleiphilus sp. HI0125]
MSQFFQIHPDNPQARLIRQAVDIVRSGGIIAYPTDSAYALGCEIGNKAGADKIRAIRQLTDKHNFTLVCRDLSDISVYAKVGNSEYRQIKAHTPGPYTFILRATSEVPRRLMHPKRRQIGLRIPDNKIALDLLEELGTPLMSTSLILPGEEYPFTDPYEIRQTLEHQLDLVIDGGYCGLEPSSVIDLSDDQPMVLRKGAGDTLAFE